MIAAKKKRNSKTTWPALDFIQDAGHDFFRWNYG